MKRKIALVALALCLVVLPAGILFVFNTVVRPYLVVQAAAGVYAVPAITLYFKEFLDNPERRFQSTARTVAYRSDGGVVEVIDRFSRKGDSHRERTVRLPDGMKVILYDSIATKTTWRLTRNEFETWQKRSHFDPKSDCTSNLLGEVNGREFQSRDHRSALPSVRIRYKQSPGTEVWYAPQFGCLEIGRLARFKDSGGVARDSSELTLESYSLGEPNPSLFEVPLNFEEASPIEAQRRLLRKRGAPQLYIDRLDSDPGIKQLNDSYMKANH